jgi:phosphoglycerate dehydrogenase-like enzyme
MRITVVGSINLDLVATAPRLPAPGETVTGATLSRHPGGKGANQALAARRLGAEVSLIGRVGDDEMSGAAVALMLASLRQVVAADRWVREGHWVSRGGLPLTTQVRGRRVSAEQGKTKTH